MMLLDFAILGVLALALVRGYMVGGIRQITSIVGMVLAFVVAVQYMRPLGGQMEAWGVAPTFAELAAFATLFLGVYMSVALVARMAERIIKVMRLGVVDHVLGSVLSGAKVLLVISGLLMLLAQAGWPAPETREASTFYEPVSEALPVAWDHTAAYVGNTEELDHFFPDAHGDTAHPPNDPNAPQIGRLLPVDLMRLDEASSSDRSEVQVVDEETATPPVGW